MLVLDIQSTDKESGCQAIHIQEVQNVVVLQIA